MKIFIFGSCRTNYLKTNDKYSVIKNHDFIHTTKEVLQYLDFFDNKKNIMEALYPSGIIFNDYLDFFELDYTNVKKNPKYQKIDIDFLTPIGTIEVKNNYKVRFAV